MENLKYLKEEEILTKIDKEEAKKKKLIIDDKCDLYMKIQALYKKVFDYYIEENIPIKNIVDKSLKSSNLDFGKQKEEQKNQYQKFSYLDSEYLFVRNFFYIERLDKENIEIFKKKIERKDYEINDEMVEIVKQTYEDIITVKTDRITGEFKTFYGYSSPNFLFDNNSLVLFLNYGRNTIELQGEEFIKNAIKKEEYLEKVINEVKDIFEEKLKYKTEVRYYKGVI